jgi:hypothetical protein
MTVDIISHIEPSVWNTTDATKSASCLDFVGLDLLCVMFCRSLFVLLSFFFWTLYGLSLFDLRILIIKPKGESRCFGGVSSFCYTKGGLLRRKPLNHESLVVDSFTVAIKTWLTVR